TDNNTLLMWEKKVAVSSLGCPTDPANLHSVDLKCTWTQATGVWIAAINAANLGGHNDWRIPNVRELQSIVDYSKPFPGPTVASSLPGLTAADFYWSSTSHATLPSENAWQVNFIHGYTTFDRKFGALRVRAVRGGR